jgi:hypothetical protein
VKTFQKHHFGEWTNDHSTLGGFAKTQYGPEDARTECTRCHVHVKMGRTGGMKFFVGGKWISKRPPCQVSEG